MIAKTQPKTESLSLPDRRLVPLVHQGNTLYSLYSFSGKVSTADEQGNLVPTESWKRCPILEGFFPAALVRTEFFRKGVVVAAHHHAEGEVFVAEHGRFCIELVPPNSRADVQVERVILESTDERMVALRLIPHIPHRIIMLSDQGALRSYADSNTVVAKPCRFPHFERKIVLTGNNL